MKLPLPPPRHLQSALLLDFMFPAIYRFSVDVAVRVFVLNHVCPIRLVESNDSPVAFHHQMRTFHAPLEVAGAPAEQPPDYGQIMDAPPPEDG